ncbi:hypothetical protein [Lichenicoccus sp.]|uniref:hypothetical protein n=1 Tax=Lichenicoccus sp. TaxID=2781899 RepID=UPI003D0D95D5
MNTIPRLTRTALALAAMTALAGCGPTGPIFGDWQGRQPSGFGINPSFVDLVLHGNPGDIQGEYDIQATEPQTTLDYIGERNLIWGDRWTITRDAASGLPILHLHNLPNSQISTYAMLQDHVLVPVTPDGRPDLSRGALRYSLVPVPASSRAYGRL